MHEWNTSLKAVILVGGEGTRLRPLTHNIPKPMMPVLNRPFLEHALAHLRRYEVRDVVLAGGYLFEVVESYFGAGSSLGLRLTYAVEDRPLGTAGAVKNVQHHLDTTFAVLNGDIFSHLDIADMLAFHRHNRAKATIALSWVSDASAYGVVETDSNGRVRRFIEKPSPDRVTSHWINAGLYILEPEVLGHVPANSFYTFEKGLFPLLIERGEPVYGYPFSGYWLDMGTPGKYLQLNCDLLLLEAKSALINSLSQGEVCCGEDVTIHPSAEIVGPVVIGSGCHISRGVRITGPAVIGSDCYLEEGSSIDRAVVWRGVNICAGATLRQCIVGSDTKVADKAQVINCTVAGDQKAML